MCSAVLFTCCDVCSTTYTTPSLQQQVDVIFFFFFFFYYHHHITIYIFFSYSPLLLFYNNLIWKKKLLLSPSVVVLLAGLAMRTERRVHAAEIKDYYPRDTMVRKIRLSDNSDTSYRLLRQKTGRAGHEEIADFVEKEYGNDKRKCFILWIKYQNRVGWATSPL